MEALLNLYGWLAFWPVMLAVGMPLVLAGLVLRRRGRRGADRIALARSGRRALRDVGPGVVTVEGRWRRFDGDGDGDGSRGIIQGEDAGACAVVECDEGAAAGIAEGTPVLVTGWATHQVQNPLGASYREQMRVWLIEARRDPRGGAEQITTRLDALERGAVRARRLSRVGAALFAAGIGAGITSGLIVHRAMTAVPSYDSYRIDVLGTGSAAGSDVADTASAPDVSDSSEGTESSDSIDNSDDSDDSDHGNDSARATD